MSWWNGKSIVNLLSESCICRAFASVAFPALQTLCQGEFAGLDDDQLTLLLFPDEQEDFQADCLCCVTFNHQYRPHVFLSSVVSLKQDLPGEPYRLSLEIPSQVLIDKRRIAFRVPVSDNRNLQVWVKTPDGQTWAAETRNLSVAGMLIEFPTEPAPPLDRGDLLEVFLQMPQEETRVEAEVMRCNGAAFGLAFPGSVRNRQLDPPPALESMVRTLERRHCQSSISAGTPPVDDFQPV